MANIIKSQSRIKLAMQESLNDAVTDEYEGDINILPQSDPEYAPSRAFITRSLSAGVNNCTINGEMRYIPYTNIHCRLDKKVVREYFMPGQKINISINRERQGNVIIYAISIRHGDFHWSVRHRLTNFQSLHNALRARLLLTAAEKITKFVRGHKNGSKDINLLQSIFSRMPTRPDSWLNPDELDHRKEKLESYLNFVLKITELRNHVEMYRFLEVSRLSFVNQLGAKWKEGFIRKLSGGRYNETKLFHNSRKRWMVIKDTYLAYMRPKDDHIRDVILMDLDFSVEISATNSCQLFIRNLNRTLTLKAWNSQHANEWKRDILAVSQSESSSAVDFTTPNRFESFAPIREESYANWFQDGRSYMNSVADAIEMAKEEIFITDWWLSPEILLKRPNVDCKWRLDNLLKRKAEQGVSIFLLLYKEISYILQLNSLHTKRMLTELHPNIKVMRHPDKIVKWTHHEKCVIIDQKVAFFGGIDLCFGRWDTKSHLLTDLGTVGSKDDLASNTSNISPCSSYTGGLLNTQVSEYENNLKFIESIEMSSNTDSDTTLEEGSSSTSLNPIVANCLRSLLDDVREKNAGSSNESLEKRGSLEKHAVPDIIVRMEEQDIRFRKRYKTEPAVNLRKVEGFGSPPSRRMSGYSCYFNSDGEPLPLQHYLENSREDRLGAQSVDNLAGGDIARARCDSVLVRVRGQSGHWPLTGRGNISLDIRAAVAKLRHKSRMSVTDSNDYLTKEQKGIYLKATLKTHVSNMLPHRTRVGNFISAVRGESNTRINDLRNSGIKEKDEEILLSLVERNRSREEADDDLESSHRWWLGKDYTNFIIKEFDTGDFVNPFSDGINRYEKPRMPWHDIGGVVYGKAARDMARHFIQRWNFTKNQKRKTSASYPHLMPKSYRRIVIPDTVKMNSYKTKCQVLRSLSQWSGGLSKTEDSIYQAYLEMIYEAKHYIYIENQFFISSIKSIENQVIEAIFQRIVKAHKLQETFRVYIVMPLLPAFEDELGDSISGALRVILYWNYQTISRGGNSLLERLMASGVTSPFEYITFYGLRGYGELPASPRHCKPPPPGDGAGGDGAANDHHQPSPSPPDRLTTELVYVHSKLMIVDDIKVLIGSANINDRSLIGKRDSELAVIIEDESFVSSKMNGEDYKAGRFAFSLRKSLFREHLGITKDKIDVSDPISESFYKKIWLRQASINTGIYDKVFACIPNNHIKTFEDLAKSARDSDAAFYCKHPREAKHLLDTKIQGHLVLLPLEFLKDEALQPRALSREGMLPDIWV